MEKTEKIKFPIVPSSFIQQFCCHSLGLAQVDEATWQYLPSYFDNHLDICQIS